MGYVPASPQTQLVDGHVDYRLARQAVLNDYKAGALSRLDVCDAHPELRRAATEYSTPTTQACPICVEDNVARVNYVFGPRLPAHGRCINTEAEFARIRRRKGTFTCYVVEVCPSCAWNHLLRAYVL